MQEFDYIVVGAGSAGCVLASRLTESPGNSVLLLEAGGKDNHIFYKMPAGVIRLLGGQRGNWYYHTEPQQNLDGRSLYWPRGKVLGGSSSINGMIYIRGHARDYDHWRQLGLEGWSFADVLPYFRRSEANENGADAFHGHDGPLAVSNAHSPNPLFRAFIDAGGQAGYPLTDDFNGPRQEGFGPYQFTIRKGERCSTSMAFLRPALSRPNLKVETGALASRILLDGKRAVGVEYIQGGRTRTARARQTVILAGGVINSPQLLQLSGIGDGERLSALGIKTVHHLPGVGQNLQDHLDCTVINRCLQPITLHSQLNPITMGMTGIRYLVNGTGPGTSNGLESGAYVKSLPDLELPDLQFHFVAAVLEDHGRARSPGHGFTVHYCQLRPESRGSVLLGSADPRDAPLIQPNYLATDTDRRAMREGARIIRNVLRQPAMASYLGEELQPGAARVSDDELDAWVRARAETIYHPVGTAKMGLASDPFAVVDARCRVLGFDGLRVVDASVMPTLIGGNTNAPTIMIAEKIADDILGRPALAPIEFETMPGDPIPHQAPHSWKALNA